MTCTNKKLIGLFGTVYFIGFAASSGFIPRIADHIGRKKPFIVSIFIQTVAYACLFISTNVYFTISMFTVIGIVAGGRVGIASNYMNEFSPQKYQNACQAALNVLDASVMIFQAVMYYFTRDWLPVHIVGISGALVILIVLTTLIPESPKFYYSRKKFDEARDMLAWVEKVNGGQGKIKNCVFDTEVAMLSKSSFEEEI